MPELPEVETYARQLRPHLVGRQFTYVNVFWPRTVAVPEAAKLPAQLAGQKVERVGRRGKYLRFWLDSGDQLLIHLKMSGRLRIEGAEIPPNPHDRVIFGLDNGQEMRFNNMRKFGRVYLIPWRDQQCSPLQQLGPEPLGEDFTLEGFARRIEQRSGGLKPLLLNQSFLAGLGNIYVDEVLFQAHIHPERKANTLTSHEVAALYQAIRATLQQSIASLGTSFDPVYTGGLRESAATYQNYLQVYQRTGESCPRCGQTIERITMGGRGTHLCPKCQRKEAF
jgi:formamidopyrimidine-DNA glycosylase